MYGVNIGNLSCQSLTGNGVWQTRWSTSGQQHNASDSSWTFMQLALPGGTTRVRWEGGHTGSFRGDTALDTIAIEAGSSPPSAAPVAAPTAVTCDVTITTQGLRFVPAAVTVTVGQTVCWTPGPGHNVVQTQTQGGCSASTAPIFGSPAFGDRVVHVFTQPHTYFYMCSQHCSFGMVGEIRVLAQTTAAPTVAPTSSAPTVPLPPSSNAPTLSTRSPVPAFCPQPTAPTPTPSRPLCPVPTTAAVESCGPNEIFFCGVCRQRNRTEADMSPYNRAAMNALQLQVEL